MEFTLFWTEMSWIVILLFVLSIGFAIAEGLIPGFGVCGIMSVICATGALVLEGVFTKSVFAVLFLLVLYMVIGIVLFAIFVRSARKGILRKTPIIESKSSVPQNYGEDLEKKLLVGKVGVVVSECKPVGKAEFEGKTFTIISRNHNISIGKLVVVEEIKDNSIFVKEIKGGKDE